jgi:hypothetical protein
MSDAGEGVLGGIRREGALAGAREGVIAGAGEDGVVAGAGEGPSSRESPNFLISSLAINSFALSVG